MRNQQGNYPNRPQRRPDSPNRPPAPRRPNTPQSPRDNTNTMSKPPKAKNEHLFIAFVLVVVTVVICIFLAIFILRSASDLFGLNQADKEYTVEIPENTDIKSLSTILHNNGIVDQKITFRLIAELKGEKLIINPGKYTLNSNMAYEQIFSILKTGDLENQFVNLTIIEVLTIDEIAQLLQENQVCDAQEFIQYLQTEDFSDYTFFHKLPTDNPNRYLKLEGYVFPDTYEFYVNEKVSSVVKKFLTNFERRLSSDLLARMDELDMTIDETVTLASIIQKEAGDPAEMRKVSSVFHNRLNNSATFPQLQSDVTIFYVNDHIKGFERPYTIGSTQEVFDAYNTYVCNGLPAGPICNPGFDAIMAALYPAETSYNYFVTDVEGKYYYATTLAEHESNVGIAMSQDETGQGHINGGILTPNANTPDAQK